ncbi:MAG: TlyA family RNA methyltransferase [Acidimicrobiales bacterium]
MRRRLDNELVRRGLARSRHQAADLVARGVVLVGGAVAEKPARLVDESEPVVVAPAGPRFVSRGGEKLDAALARFAISVEGRRCLDAGASTGGFTDCLLQRGAAHVTAVDVARGKIDPRLRADGRVTLLERTNIRHLDRASTSGLGFEVVVADLSFISLTSVTDVLADRLADPGTDLVLLVKPQFEVGRQVASRGKGVVKDPAERRAALERVVLALASARARVVAAMASPLLGPSGNAEFLLHATAHDSKDGPGAVAGGVDEATGRMLDDAVDAAPDRPSKQARKVPMGKVKDLVP